MALKLNKKQKEEGWTVVRFDQVAREAKGTTKDPEADGLEFYVGLEHLDPQSLRIVRKGLIAEDKPTFTKIFAPGHILFGKRRSYQKKAAVADFAGICSGDIIVMEAIPKSPMIAGLLPFIVQSDGFFDFAEKTSMGSLSPRTKWASLAEYEFPLPPPERQRQILKLLQKVETVLDCCSQTYKSAQAAKSNLQIEKLNNPLLTNFKLKELCEKIQDGTHFSPKTTVSKNDFKYITSKNIRNGYLDLTNVEYLDAESHKQIYKRCNVKQGDILITKDGANTGNACINPLEEEFSLLSSVAIIRADKKKLDPDFLLHYLLSPICQRKIQLQMAGNAITRLTLEKINSLEIPALDISIQKQYGELFKYIMTLEFNLIEKIRKLSKMKHWLVVGATSKANQLEAN